MRYLYPNFPTPKLGGLIRVSGPGLGNLLFDYAETIVLADQIGNCKIIWPTWWSIKIGTFLRRERDKRLYLDLFKNDGSYISGVEKIKLLLFKHKICTDDFFNDQASFTEDSVLMCSKYPYSFVNITGKSELIWQHLLTITREKHKNALKEDFRNVVGIHVRLGDFVQGDTEGIKTGQQSRSMPVSWYCKVVDSLSDILGKGIKYYVFSDASDLELQDLLNKSNVERKFYGSALGDMIALQQCKIIVSTLSSFALWAIFGGADIWITYPSFITNELAEGLEANRENFVAIGSEIGAFSTDQQQEIKGIFLKK